MIVFDLRCPAGHVFEAWFASSTAYEKQCLDSQLSCPLCGAKKIEKAVMAPAVAAKANRAPVAVKALQRLAAEQAKALQSSEWVGGAFATRARAMHAGEEAQAAIHGQASLAEAMALVDDGVPIAPLPLPVVPPERIN